MAGWKRRGSGTLWDASRTVRLAQAHPRASHACSSTGTPNGSPSTPSVAPTRTTPAISPSKSSSTSAATSSASLRAADAQMKAARPRSPRRQTRGEARRRRGGGGGGGRRERQRARWRVRAASRPAARRAAGNSTPLRWCFSQSPTSRRPIDEHRVGESLLRVRRARRCRRRRARRPTSSVFFLSQRSGDSPGRPGDDLVRVAARRSADAARAAAADAAAAPSSRRLCRPDERSLQRQTLAAALARRQVREAVRDRRRARRCGRCRRRDRRRRSGHVERPGRVGCAGGADRARSARVLRRSGERRRRRRDGGGGLGLRGRVDGRERSTAPPGGCSTPPPPRWRACGVGGAVGG